MNEQRDEGSKLLATLIVAILLLMLVSSCSPDNSPPRLSLGKTYDECEALYGPGKLEKFDAPHRKMMLYISKSDEKTRAVFYDGVVIALTYYLVASSVEDKQLNYYLQLNANGHTWKLVHAVGRESFEALWKRDDGATAKYTGDDHQLTLLHRSLVK